ncbi:unnamed protein product [Leuciscus chuanchicus]
MSLSKFAASPGNSLSRACPAACGALIAAKDLHSFCMVCLGLKHAQEALETPENCSHCLMLPKKLLRRCLKVAATQCAELGSSLWRYSLRSGRTAKKKNCVLDSVTCGDIDCDPAPKSKTWIVLDSCLDITFPEFGSDELFWSTPDTTLDALMEFSLTPVTALLPEPTLAPATAPLPAPEPTLAPATALLPEPNLAPATAPLPAPEPTLTPATALLPEPTLAPATAPLPAPEPTLTPATALLPEPTLAPATAPLPAPEPTLAPATAPLAASEPTLAPATAPLPAPEPTLAPATDPLPAPEPTLAPATAPLPEPTLAPATAPLPAPEPTLAPATALLPEPTLALAKAPPMRDLCKCRRKCSDKFSEERRKEIWKRYWDIDYTDIRAFMFHSVSQIPTATVCADGKAS